MRKLNLFSFMGIVIDLHAVKSICLGICQYMGKSLEIVQTHSPVDESGQLLFILCRIGRPEENTYILIFANNDKIGFSTPFKVRSDPDIGLEFTAAWAEHNKVGIRIYPNHSAFEIDFLFRW
jgi:hypothetical protein